MLRRIAFALLFFWIIDLALNYAISNPLDAAFDNNYRFKEGTDISPLGIYINHIKTAKKSSPDKQIIAFLGSSPTYGHRIKNPGNTYPYAFEASVSKMTMQSDHSNHTGIQQKANTPKVFNLASNGQLVADQYYIAQALIDSADAFVIQLNYHTFDPGDKQRPKIRYTDLPQRLGLHLSGRETGLLGIATGIQPTATRLVSGIARRSSFTFANREYIAANLFGGLPEDVFFNQIQKSLGLHPATAIGPGTDTPGLFGESDTPFGSLSPVQKMLIVKRCSTLYDFDISQNDSEIYFLKQLAALLANHKKQAIFFMTPLNVEALDEYGIINWDKYDKNSAIIKSIVEHNGLRYIDANAGEGAVPSDQFFDISHTLDSGGQTFGTWLAAKSKGYLWGRK